MADYGTLIRQPGMAGKCRHFVGPNFDKYKPVIGQLHNSGNPIGFNWLGFFAPMGWLFYRKLYLFGLILFFSTLVLSFVSVILGFLMSTIIGFYILFFYKGIYARYVIKKVDKISKDFKNENQLKQELQKNGGVSVAAGVIVSAINFIFAVLSQSVALGLLAGRT